MGMEEGPPFTTIIAEDSSNSEEKVFLEVVMSTTLVPGRTLT